MERARLSGRALRGLERAGDVLVPGDDLLPRFSASLCAAEADRALDFVPAGDRKGLLLLLAVLSFLPGGAIARLLAAGESARGPLAPLLRQVHIGVKGLVMSLYWSDLGQQPSPLALVGWEARCGEGGRR